MRACDARISDDVLLDYWLGDVAIGDADALEQHVFECENCTARLERLASLQGAVAALARQGRVSGLISRALLNRLQRDGLHVRWYSLAPGETVPCAIFPEDDLVVTSLRADFSAVRRVSLSVVAPGAPSVWDPAEIEVSPSDTEVLLALSGAQGRALPSMRLELTLTAIDPERRFLGQYVLDHTALD